MLMMVHHCISTCFNKESMQLFNLWRRKIVMLYSAMKHKNNEVRI